MYHVILPVGRGKTMTEDDPTTNDSRRNFLKGAAATGITATGLIGFSGSAAAQQNVRELQLNVQQASDGLITLQVQNVNVLRNVNVQDVVVTVIGGDLRILEGGININDSLIEINNNDIDVNVLNDSVVQVAVAVLGEAGNVVAAGDTIA